MGVEAWSTPKVSWLLHRSRIATNAPVTGKRSPTCGRQKLYEITGIQLMGINTIFQLAAHDLDESAQASSLLMLPELMVHDLTGVITGERTSAGRRR